MRALDPNSPTPAIRQIADAIRDAIHTGELSPGDRIPGQAALVTHFGVAKGTVDTAINALKAEGLLIGRQGAGVFVRTDAGGQDDEDSVLARIEARLARIEKHLGITDTEPNAARAAQREEQQ
jgi:DNA-binding GntR family transcriptional regulator